jgi:hypothetical protein
MIDFSRCVGWAIPEGNVVQVADESGKVLWRSAANQTGMFYLRPAEDISVDGEIVPTPAGIAAAYMLIDEEVTDASATTIGVAASAENTGASGTAKFRMGGSVPENVEEVTDIHFVVSAMVSGANDVASEGSAATANVRTEITVGGTSHTWRPVGHLDSPVSYDYVNANYDPRECETHSKQEILDVINAVLSEIGELPDIALEVELSAWEYTASSNKGNVTMGYGYAKMSQAYIALDYKPKGGGLS